MSQSPFKTKQFFKKREIWYSILQEMGFKDIEERCSPDEKLKQWHSMYLACHYSNEEIFEKTRYYELCSQLLHSHSFESKQEKDIWELHTEGLSITEIHKKTNVKRYLVHRIIKKLQIWIV